VRYILASWCSDGFECLQDITSLHPDHFEKGQIIEALKGNAPEKNPLYHQITMMQLRARYNSQRQYEIYVFATEENVEFKDIQDWMEEDPQSLVEWIRINYHSKIHSDYRRKHKQIV
jgi:hypothetical protein